MSLPLDRPPSPAGRWYFLDALRIGAFAWLVPYHVGMVYVTWDFHVKSPTAGPALEPLMQLTAPWRMSLLFLVSGTATGLMLARAAPGAVLRRRARLLLLPLLLGVCVIVPPQAWVEARQRFGYGGGYAEFLRLYFSADRGFCDGRGCLVLPTWNHLWFLPYLAVYTALLAAVHAARPQALAAAARALQRLARHPLRLLLLTAAALALLRATVGQRWPATHALVDDPYSHAVYLPMFVAGAALASTPQAWDRIATRRWAALALALVCWALWVHGGAGRLASHALVGVLHAGALMAAVGFARRHLDVDWPGRAALNEALFPMYLVHQTVIVGLAAGLPTWGLPPLLEGMLLTLAAFGAGAATYRAVRGVRGLRPWFGLRPQPVAAAPPTDGGRGPSGAPR